MIIEKTICDYLNGALDEYAFPEQPADKPASYVLVEKTGSSRRDYITQSTVAIQSYAESMYEAAKLNEKVKNAVDSMIALSDVYSVRLNSDYNFTDTSRKKYRYQAVYDITHC